MKKYLKNCKVVQLGTNGLTKEDPRVAKYIEGGKRTQFKGEIELCRKAGKANKGIKKPPRTKEHIEKLAASKRGVQAAEATKQKQSEAQKARWAFKKGLSR